MDPTWQKIILAGVPPSLKFFLANFQKNADSPEELKKQKSLFLLHGPPGGGKTSAARLLAMILHRPLLEISCPGVQTKYKGSAVENLVKMLRPAFDSFNAWVICLDEVDALNNTNGNSSETSSSQSRSNAFGILQKLKDNSANPNITLIMTTNFKSKIPHSVLSRIERGSINVPLPDYDTRRKIAALLLEKKNILYSPCILDIIARETGGMIPAITSGLSVREIFGIICAMEDILKMHSQAISGITSAYDPALIVTPEVTYQAIKFVRNNISDEGYPTTAEGRLLKKYMDNKHFWPAVNAFTSLWSTAIATAGYQLQKSGDRRAERDEERNIERIDRERRGEDRAERDEKRSIENQKMQKAGLMLTHRSGKFQAETHETQTKNSSDNIVWQALRGINVANNNRRVKNEATKARNDYEQDTGKILKDANVK